MEKLFCIACKEPIQDSPTVVTIEESNKELLKQSFCSDCGKKVALFCCDLGRDSRQKRKKKNSKQILVW